MVSALLERKASEAEKEQGLDLADYLIKFDYKDFISEDDATAIIIDFDKWIKENSDGGIFCFKGHKSG